VAEILLLHVSELILEFYFLFDFDLFILIGMPFYIGLPDFIQIEAPCVAFCRVMTSYRFFKKAVGSH